MGERETKEKEIIKRQLKHRPLRVGFDFDGVIAYNPLRVFRLPVASFKRFFLGEKTLNFYFPKSRPERWFWKLLHESSFFPAIGFGKLKKLLCEGKIEGYLLTGRYSFLEDSFWRWLKKHKVDKLFAGYYLNKGNEQPHLFKERIIKKLKLDIFVEDNWDIVNYLNSKFQNPNVKSIPNFKFQSSKQTQSLKSKTQNRLEPRTLNLERGEAACEIHWIYNILDREKAYKNKHPHLQKFLEAIV